MLGIKIGVKGCVSENILGKYSKMKILDWIFFEIEIFRRIEEGEALPFRKVSKMDLRGLRVVLLVTNTQSLAAFLVGKCMLQTGQLIYSNLLHCTIGSPTGRIHLISGW